MTDVAAQLARCERERDALQERLTIQNLPSVATEYASRRAEAAEQEAKRSERYAEDRDLVAQEFERRVEELEAAAEWEQEHGGCFCRTCNAALNPEPYADVPGAGQRGC